MAEKLPSYGGQAVIEGVMMRGASSVAIAMRAPDQSIVVHTEPLSGIYKSKIIKIPFLRGLIALWDALGLGLKALTLSANIQTGEEEKLEGWKLYLTLGFSLVIGMALFFLLPAAIGQLAEQFLGINAWWGNLLVGYIWIVGLTPDVKRVFSYHGAEHKTINAFEDGAELVPESVAKYSVEHTRCGTAYLLSLVLISVIIFSLLGPLPMSLRLASRIILLPVIAGIAYEYLKWTADHIDSKFVQILIKPNLALQHLTTNEPTLDMLEVSIAAFKSMREAENNPEKLQKLTEAEITI